MVTHFVNLVRATAVAWWRHAAWLIGFMLFAMVARYASLLVSTQVAPKYPFFIMFGMAFGLLANLAMIILAIRAMSDHLGVAEQPSIRRTLETSLVPFLLIYLAFGYMATYTTTLMYVVQARFSFSGLSDLLGALNPTQSTHALVTVIVIFVVSFAVEYSATWIEQKTSASWMAMVPAYCSAVRWVLGVFSITRLWEVVRFWVNERQFSAWWDSFGDWVASLMPTNLPELLARSWGYFADSIWPGLWELLIYPLVWFALVIVVVGGKFLDVNTVYDQVLRPKGGNFIRRLVLDGLLQDLNVRWFPIVRALRDMVKATVPFLGAYVVLFTLLTWVGDGLQRLVSMAIGVRPDAMIIAMHPLVVAIPSVLIMSFQIALLAAAYQQAAKLATAPRPARGTAIAHGAVVALVAASLVVVQAQIMEGAEVTVRTASQGVSNFRDSSITVSNIRIGTEVTSYSRTETTPQRFVALTLTAYSHTVVRGYRIVLIADGHTYPPYDDSLWISTVPGFFVTTDYVFEVNTDDLGGPVFAEVRPTLAMGYQQEYSRFQLDPDLLAAPSQGNIVEVDASVRKTLP